MKRFGEQLKKPSHGCWNGARGTFFENHAILLLVGLAPLADTGGTLKLWQGAWTSG